MRCTKMQMAVTDVVTETEQPVIRRNDDENSALQFVRFGQAQ